MDPESPSCSKIVIVWTEGETRLLLDKYAAYLAEIGPCKQFRSKKDMWMKVSLEFEGRSWKQCEERFKTVMKRKKAAVDNNTSSGSKRQHLQFGYEVEKINQLDDSIEPAVQISSQHIQKKCQSEVVPKVAKPKKQKTVQETLLEIALRKEEAIETRHKERMERADEIENLLNRLISEKK